MKIALLLLLAAPVFACDTGCSEYKLTPNHVIPCACNAETLIGEPVKPSDEKPRMSGQPVEQVMVIDQAKPAEATDEDGLDAMAVTGVLWKDREFVAREKALRTK